MAQPSLASAAFMVQALFAAFMAQQPSFFASCADAVIVISAIAISAAIIMVHFLVMLFIVVSPNVVYVR
jgi:hypothetical protein